MLSKKGEIAQRIAERAVGSYASYVAHWAQKVDALKVHANAIPLEPITAEDLAIFDELVDDMESLADFRARNLQAFRKRTKRDIAKARDPSIAAVSRDTARRLQAIDEQVIDKLLDFGLFMRAVRAERVTDNIVGDYARSPSELRAMLRRDAA